MPTAREVLIETHLNRVRFFNLKDPHDIRFRRTELFLSAIPRQGEYVQWHAQGGYKEFRVDRIITHLSPGSDNPERQVSYELWLYPVSEG